MITKFVYPIFGQRYISPAIEIKRIYLDIKHIKLFINSENTFNYRKWNENKSG